MTEKLKGGVLVPYYALGIIVSIIMAIFSWGLATASNGSEIRTTVKTNVDNIKELKIVDIRLQAEKADKNNIDDIKRALERIEGKLDIHIAK